jgi:hypothetical protein
METVQELLTGDSGPERRVTGGVRLVSLQQTGYSICWQGTSHHLLDPGPERADLLSGKLSVFCYCFAGLNVRSRDQDCRGKVPEGNLQPN